MNKKSIIIALAISLGAVLVVALGFAALKDYFMPVRVNSVEFTIDESHEEYLKTDETYDGYVLRFCVDDITSYQLTWVINPEDAENKEVSFSSSNAEFQVSNTGLVTFENKDKVTEITVKTVDQEKTDTLKIETYSNKASEANYSFETNSFADGEDYFVQDDVLYLYNAKTYAFTLDYDVVFEKSNENDTLYSLTNNENVFTLQTSATGTFEIKAKSDDIEKTISVKVVEKVTDIMVTNSNVDENFAVGTANAYKLPISVSTAGGTNAELVYSLTKKGETQTTEGAVFNYTVADFSAIETGVYTLKVSAKYNPLMYKEIEFTLNDGYNVTSHKDLALYYNDENVKTINIVNDIIIELDEEDKDVVKNVSLLQEKPEGIYLNDSAKFIYYRETAITVNGNKCEIDASKIPHQYINTELGHNRTILFGCGDYELKPGMTAVQTVGKKLKKGPEIYRDVENRVKNDCVEMKRQEWLAGLRQKYGIEMDKSVLKTVNNDGSK